MEGGYAVLTGSMQGAWIDAPNTLMHFIRCTMSMAAQQIMGFLLKQVIHYTIQMAMRYADLFAC